MARYAYNSGAVFSLKLHLVWCSKYRRPVLTGPVEGDLRRLLLEKSLELGLIVHALEIMPDHVHLFIGYDPTRSVAEVVNRLKGFTSHELRSAHPSLRSRLPTLWSRSYYSGSVGHVSDAVVRRYIAAQKGR